MTFDNEENPCYETTCGKKIWGSRSAAVCVEILRPNPEDTTALQVLAVKRGKELTNPGQWCFPCGYMDWNEDHVDAARREVFEETGLELSRSQMDMYEVDSRPEAAFQNITFHFVVLLLDDKQEPSVINDEVEASEWVNLNDLEGRDWAFDHKDRISRIIKNG